MKVIPFLHLTGKLASIFIFCKKLQFSQINLLKFRKNLITNDSLPPWYDDNGILTVSIYDFLLDRTIIEK